MWASIYESPTYLCNLTAIYHMQHSMCFVQIQCIEDWLITSAQELIVLAQSACQVVFNVPISQVVVRLYEKCLYCREQSKKSVITYSLHVSEKTAVLTASSQFPAGATRFLLGFNQKCLSINWSTVSQITGLLYCKCVTRKCTKIQRKEANVWITAVFCCFLWSHFVTLSLRSEEEIVLKILGLPSAA